MRNDFLEGEKACDNYQEAVYRTLPIYRVGFRDSYIHAMSCYYSLSQQNVSGVAVQVRTPPMLYAPENSFIMEDDKSLMGLYAGDVSFNFMYGRLIKNTAH